MSNHLGSYMLNDVFMILDHYEFFKTIGADKTLAFVKKIDKLCDEYDCNINEILQDIGEKLRICYVCLKYADNFEDGICLECRQTI